MHLRLGPEAVARGVTAVLIACSLAACGREGRAVTVSWSIDSDTPDGWGRDAGWPPITRRRRQTCLPGAAAARGAHDASRHGAGNGRCDRAERRGVRSPGPAVDGRRLAVRRDRHAGRRQPDHRGHPGPGVRPRRRRAAAESPHVDVLRLPVVGALLRWRHVGVAFQLVLLAVAAVVVLHGLFGPQIAPRNLATVLTSIHWRGLLVSALLVAGNLFCAGVPDGARRATPADASSRPGSPGRDRCAGNGSAPACWCWCCSRTSCSTSGSGRPRPRGWCSVTSGSRWSWICCSRARRSASTSARSASSTSWHRRCRRPSCRCATPRRVTTCRTYDCIKGRRSDVDPLRVVQRGCELGLFLPGKVGNLDCTLCLDCVHACPHDNIGLVTRVPGLELLELRRRSGIGRLAAAP